MLYEQYRTLKRAHPNAVLLLKVVDCYQTFDNDAQTLAQVTGRKCRAVTPDSQRVNTCCVPAAHVDTAIETLLHHGYKVAVAEPVNEPHAGHPVGRVTTDARLTDEGSAHV